VIAKTDAAGARGLLPEVLAFTSSLSQDRALLAEDLVGSLAHLHMLARCGIVARDDALKIHGALVDLWTRAAADLWSPQGEEDVHMAVEAELTRALGEVAGRLHTARSRNDQVALDLRLHVRAQAAGVLETLGALLSKLAELAAAEVATLIPSYTHRQRAQPVSLGYVLAGYGAMLARDVDAFAFALDQADVLPLGVGAISGTSLPIDREVTRGLLRFARISQSGIDTVGDRDFALDFAYATCRCLLHASRIATDFVDFSSSEFGFVKLHGELACGSSMMPQKRNPDVFELIRGKSGAAVGNLTSLMVTLKGLPGGYNRDLQEDRGPVLASGPLAKGVLGMLRVALENVTFDHQRCAQAASDGYTQATDLAEALVKRGVPFRSAYQMVGTLVREAQRGGVALSDVPLALAQSVDPRFDAELLAAAKPDEAVLRKETPGGTGPRSVLAQVEQLRGAAARAGRLAAATPALDHLFHALKERPL